MALFDDVTLLKDEKKAKDTLKSAFAKVNDRGTKFLYYERVTVGAKEVPALAIVDYAPDFESKLKAATGKAPLARGTCHATDRNELAFGADTGSVKLEALKKFMATVPGVRPVSVAAQEAPAVLQAKGTPGAATTPGDGKPDPALLKRLGTLNAEVKKLPAEQADALIATLKKAAALVQSGDPKNAPEAAKLLDKLEPIVLRAPTGQAPQVEAQMLAQARSAVEQAYKDLPAQPATLRADIEATPEAKAYAKLITDASQAKMAAGASKLLLKKIGDLRTLAEAWPATTSKATKDFDEAVAKTRAAFAKSGPERVDGHLQHPAAIRIKQLCGDPGAYAKGDDLKTAMQQHAQALKDLEDRMGKWDTAVAQLNTAVKADLDKVDKDLRTKVEAKVKEDAPFKVVNELIKRGRKEVLDPPLLAGPLGTLRNRIAALADEESRRVRAAALVPKLQAHRPAVATAIQACTDLITRAGAPLPALEATWRTAAVQNALTADVTTVTGWRTAATTLRDDIDHAITALGAEPPPAAQAITDAEALLHSALPDLAATKLRVEQNLATTSAAGILKQIEPLLQQAMVNQHLSNTRVGNLRAALKKTPKTLAGVQQDITDAVYAQNHPKPSDWLQVLQLPNVKATGNLRVAKVGDVTFNGKRVPVHLTLYLANVDTANSPHLGMTPAAIINTMLPNVAGNVGTHVTAEVYGDKSRDNPHYFKGATSGVPNGLAGNTEWDAVATAMGQLLNAEIVRLTALVTQHIARHGVWPGE